MLFLVKCKKKIAFTSRIVTYSKAIFNVRKYLAVCARINVMSKSPDIILDIFRLKWIFEIFVESPKRNREPK